jgi:hypothetical protein
MTNLSASDLTKLTVLIDGQPRGRLATIAKTVERLRKTLAEVIGDAAATVIDRAMVCETYGGAEAVVKAALKARDQIAVASATPPEPSSVPQEDSPATAPRPARKTREGARTRARLLDLKAEASAGKLPTPPDFSAATHARFRSKLEGLIALAGRGDIEGLRAVAINPVSSSPKALARYRDLCIAALEARKGA